MHMPRHLASNVKVLLAVAAVSFTHAVYAQTERDLQAARSLFNAAVHEEEQKKFERAIEKFRKVQAVKDTAVVRYRVGACLEALGRLDEAAVEYDIVVAKAEAGQRDLSASAGQKASSARQRMPLLTVKLAEPQVETEVRIDDQVLPLQRVGLEQKLNPGRHVVDAVGKGRPPFHAELDLRESSKLEVRISFGGVPSANASQSRAHSSRRDGSHRGPSLQRTAGIVSIVAGSAVIATGFVLLGVREGKISSINALCPDNACDGGLRDIVSDKQSAARTLGYGGWIAVGLGASAAIAGAALLFTLPKDRDSIAFVYPTDGGIGGGWTGRF